MYNYDKTKSFKKVLADNISISGGTSKTLYYVMDYDSTLFAALSTKMLELGGTLNLELSLYGGVIFGIEEYTYSTPTVTEVTFISTTFKTSRRLVQIQIIQRSSTLILLSLFFREG